MKPLAIIILALLPAFGLSNTPTYTPADLVQRAQASLVKIELPFEDENGESKMHYCAGFVVDAARGWALTATHCVPESFDDPIYVNEKPSEVITASQTLALVKVEPMSIAPLELAKRLPPLGTRAVSVGYGFDELTVVVRYVSSLRKGDVLLDGYLEPGMSGGPVLDEQGRVIGINRAVWTPLPVVPIGVACGPEEIREFLKAVAKR